MKINKKLPLDLHPPSAQLGAEPKRAKTPIIG